MMVTAIKERTKEKAQLAMSFSKVAIPPQAQPSVAIAIHPQAQPSIATATERYFDIRRDSAQIATGSHFWCQGHLTAQPLTEQSENKKYCLECFGRVQADKERERLEQVSIATQRALSASPGNAAGLVRVVDEETNTAKAVHAQKANSQENARRNDALQSLYSHDSLSGRHKLPNKTNTGIPDSIGTVGFTNKSTGAGVLHPAPVLLIELWRSVGIESLKAQVFPTDTRIRY